MLAARRFGLGKIVLASTGLVAALMLLPSGEPTPSQAVQQVSPLPTSPELTRFLDNAIHPPAAAKTSEQVVAEVAAAPEPVSTAPVSGLDVPTAPEDVVASTATTIPEGSELMPVRTAVNMRSGPSTSYATLFVLQPDEQVAVLEREGGWARVAKTNGTTGWVYGSYLGGVDETATGSVAAVSEPVRSVRAETAPQSSTSTLAAIGLRASPSSRSAIVMTVEPGTPLRVAERRNNWARVVVPGGMSGWVRTR